MGCFTYPEYGTWEGKTYETRHGSPYDRGSADSHYGRAMIPHYYVGDSITTECIDTADMTEDEIEAYRAGYKWNELAGDKKEY